MQSWHVKGLGGTLSQGLVATLPALLCLLTAAYMVSLGELNLNAQIAVPTLLIWAGLASWAAYRHRGQAGLPQGILLLGVGLRVLILASPASLSDDVWRYLWEGRVQLAGLDPFLHPPDDMVLEPLRNATWERVNHRSVSTIYPPGALWLFQLCARIWEQPLSWKVLSGAADVGTLVLLARAAKQRGTMAWAPVLYALHPLPIMETAGSGHLEGVALMFTAWALSAKPGVSSFAAGLGALVKVLPGVLWIPQLRAAPQRALAGAAAATLVGVVLALPFLSTGPALGRGFGTYYEAWAFNASLFPILQAIFGDSARLVGVGIGAAISAWAAWRLRDPAALLLAVTAALVLLSPVVHPWYMLWPLLPALVIGRWEWIVLASTCLLSYWVLVTYNAGENLWRESRWVVWVEYIPMAAAAAWAWSSRRSSKA